MPFPQDMFLTLCKNDPISVYRMFCRMEETIAKLEERVKHLESILKKDSHNSSKPPSSDKGHAPKTFRAKSGKTSGGQPGHQGYTLQRVDNPDHIVAHKLHGRCTCGRPLNKANIVGQERRQVTDIPVQAKLEVTEHCAEIGECLCGRIHTASFPEGVDAPIQYGERIRAKMVYLSAYQLLPQHRTVEAIRDIYGISISEGTLNNVLQQASRNLIPTETAIKAAIRGSPVMHLDETGMYVNGKRYWEHSSSTPLHTYYFCHEKRGAEAIHHGGMLWEYLGRIVHDGWKSYFDFECLHALCNAHHLRELVFIKEQYKQRWAGTMIEHLCRIKKTVDRAKTAGRKHLAPVTVQRYLARYRRIIEVGYRTNPAACETERKKGQRGRLKQHPAFNLLQRLDKYDIEVLAFMNDFSIPFDNNLAERDLRMTKVKQKVSGCFRSIGGAQAFCRIRGYISTVRKHGLGVIEYLQFCFTTNGNQVPLSQKT